MTDAAWVIEILRRPYSFGSMGRDNPIPCYGSTKFLLTMALLDGALYDIDSEDDLVELEIPPGQEALPLRFKDEALSRYILRKYTQAGDVLEEPMPQNAFLTIHQSKM